MTTRRGDPERRRPVHSGPIESWPDAEYDAVLHLLDRQIVDVDGRMVGKVDDVELVEEPDGALVPTALLVGLAALLPRFGDRFGDRLYEKWVRLAPAHSERGRPGVIEMALVEDVTSEVHLSVERAGLLHRRVPDEGIGPVRRTLGELLSMRVALPPELGPAARGRVRVLDVRLGLGDDGRTPQVAALVVGHGRPGSFLGYERSRERGPWLVAAIIRRIHRHSRLVEVDGDVELDWASRVVRVGPGAAVGPCA